MLFFFLMMIKREREGRKEGRKSQSAIE